MLREESHLESGEGVEKPCYLILATLFFLEHSVGVPTENRSTRLAVMVENRLKFDIHSGLFFWKRRNKQGVFERPNKQ